MSTFEKIAVVTNLIPEYRFPVFDALVKSGALDWRIFVTVPPEQSCEPARESLPLRHSPAYHIWLSTQHRASGGLQREPLPIPIELPRQLWRYRPDVIVAGELGLRSLLCWAVARALRVPLVLWSEEIASSARGRSRLQRTLRRFLAKRADAFLAWGKPAREYLVTIGADRERIFECTQAVDSDWWLGQARALDRSLIRQELALEGTVFLLAGRILPGKGIRNFIEAWSRLPSPLHTGIMAVIVGGGDQLRELEELVASHRLNNIKFVGAQLRSELARFYAAADIFVFPSLVDVWGLVVNEAMCFGLPILASRYAGASQEMVTPRVGIVFDPANIDEFSAYLRAWAQSPPRHARQHCEEIVRRLSFDASVQGVREMLEHLQVRCKAS